ncbi:hypothetical protein [Roseateles noduli]
MPVDTAVAVDDRRAWATAAARLGAESLSCLDVSFILILPI